MTNILNYKPKVRVMLSEVVLRLKSPAIYRSPIIQTIRNSLQCLTDFMSQFFHDFTLRSAHQ